MLKHARQHTKTVIWIVVAAFILWGAGSFVASLHEVSSSAGEVFGRRVSHREYDRVYHHVGFIARQNQTAGLVPEVISSEAWQTILLAESARQQGLAASDQEVVERIQKLLPDPDNLPDDFYANWARHTYRSSERDFEESIRDEILIQKLFDGVKEKVTLSEEEAFRMYRKEKVHFKADYVTFEKDEKEKAEAFYEEAKKNRWSLGQAANQAGRKVKATDYFKREGELKGLLSPWLLANELEKLRARRATRPLALESGYGVFAKRAVFKPQRDHFEKVKARVQEDFRRSKETTAVIEFLQTARQEANLKTYLDAGQAG